MQDIKKMIKGIKEEVVASSTISELLSLLRDPSHTFWDKLLDILTWNQYLALKLYYLIFLIAYFYRYFRHRGDGIINRKESKPWTFKVKVALQVFMTITTLAMCVEDLIDNWDSQKDSVFWNFVYILPTALWGLSIHLQYFEYKRNMSHRWYAHQAFWLLSAIMCAIILILQFVTMDH
jgi:hypothetical protein